MSSSKKSTQETSVPPMIYIEEIHNTSITHSLYSRNGYVSYAYSNSEESFRTTTSVVYNNYNSVLNFIYDDGYKQGIGSDVVVSAFGFDYPLHRFILLQSPYFSRLFDGKWKETGNGVVELDFAASRWPTKYGLDLLLSRLYGKPNQEEEVKFLWEFMDIAVYLGFESHVDLLVDIFIEGLFERDQQLCNNMPNILLCALANNYGDLSQKIIRHCKFFLLRYGWELGEAIWDDIPLDIIEEIIGSDHFFVGTEFDRLAFILGLIVRRERKLKEKQKIVESLSNNKGEINEETVSDEVEKTEELKSGSESHIETEKSLVDDSSCTSTNQEIDEHTESMSKLSESISRLKICLNSFVHFNNLSLPQLLHLKSLATKSASSATPIKSYFDSQTILEAIIQNTDRDVVIKKSSLNGYSEAGLSNLYSSFSDSKTSYIIPTKNISVVGELGDIQETLKLTSNKLKDTVSLKQEYRAQPIRISVAFENIAGVAKGIYEGKSFWYAGSKWNLFIDKATSKNESPEIGVYLKRMGRYTESDKLNQKVRDTWNYRKDQNVRMPLADWDSSLSFVNCVHASSNYSASTAVSTCLQNSSSLSVLTVPDAKLCKTFEFEDNRKNIKAFFMIYGPSGSDITHTSCFYFKASGVSNG